MRKLVNDRGVIKRRSRENVKKKSLLKNQYNCCLIPKKYNIFIRARGDREKVFFMPNICILLFHKLIGDINILKVHII